MMEVAEATSQRKSVEAVSSGNMVAEQANFTEQSTP